MARALTILFIDDDEDEQRSLRRVLEPGGYVLLSSSNAAEGLAMVGEKKPDLVLLDYRLPDLDGLAVLKRLTEAFAFPPPVVILTGQGSEMVAVEAMKAGAIDYVVKDIKANYLRLLPAVIRRAHGAFEERSRTRRLQELNNAILATVADGILGIGRDSIIVFANPAAERMLGFSEGRLVGRHLGELLRQPGPQATWESHALFQAHGGSATLRGECDLLHPESGSTFPAAYNASALDFEDGGRPGWVFAFQDITERKAAEERSHRDRAELERRVAERTAELVAANRELEGFTYSVSHDLRAPLRHLDGYVSLLETRFGTALDDQARHHLDSIADAARRMGTLVDALLAFSRLGREALAKTEVALARVVREVISELNPKDGSREVEWQVGELPVVIGDRAQLRQVFVHLLGNALKFTRPRPKARIEIDRQPAGGAEVVVFVRDNGVGFDSAYAGKLFSVFQRLHRVEEFEGTGIGLALVHRIVSRHGGRVWAEGRLGEGATFFVALPQ